MVQWFNKLVMLIVLFYCVIKLLINFIDYLGPYVYREQREKLNITWNGNGTVNYRQMSRFYFEPELSVGNLSDQIWSLNIPMIVSESRLLFDLNLNSILTSFRSLYLLAMLYTGFSLLTCFYLYFTLAYHFWFWFIFSFHLF